MSGNTEDPNSEVETIEVTIPEQKPTTIPLFLKKLWKMVNDTSAEQIIGWNPTGDGFVIYDQVKFVTELLPQYFKHNNLSSFIRQLNFYDFHKVANIDKHEMEFSHSYFLKDLPETLSFITRKVSNVKSRNTQNIKQENINEVLTGVRELKNKHSLIENELKLLKQENAALWSEINSLRIKYSKQTKVINKLIHFLISYMHSHQNSFNKSNIVAKSEQQLLRNTPQLFQIDYRQPQSANNERKTNFKVPNSNKTVRITSANSIKNSGHNFIQPKIMKNTLNSTLQSNKFSSKKYPLATMSSYPLERFITEFKPDSYNVTSPEQHDSSVASTSQFEYPIEEIVTEVDPHLEETSIYTVKFPKNEINANQNTQGIGIPNITSEQNKESSKTVEKNDKLVCDKRKLSDVNPSTSSSQKPKMLKISKQDRKNLRLKIPTPSKNVTRKLKPEKAKQSLLKGKKKIENVAQKQKKKDVDFPQPSPIKPEVILEKLMTEIENPPTDQNLSGILLDIPTNADDLGLNLESEIPQDLLENQQGLLENQNDFLLSDQQNNILQSEEDMEPVSTSPTDLLSKLTENPVDPLEQLLPESSTTEMLPTSSEPAFKGEFGADLGSYPEEILSSLSADMPQVVSPSRELLKYNIIENPKENLGMYLDNTQIQLNNIQDILNDLNSEELFDFLSCFTVDEDDEHNNSDKKQIKC